MEAVPPGIGGQVEILTFEYLAIACLGVVLGVRRIHKIHVILLTEVGFQHFPMRDELRLGDGIRFTRHDFGFLVGKPQPS